MSRIPDSPPESLLFAEYELLLPRAGYNKPTPKDFPVSDTQFTLVYTFLIVTPILQLIAILVFLARVCTRAHPQWRFTIDDYIISIAFILLNVMFGLQYTSRTWAWGGRHPRSLSVNDVTHQVMLTSIAIPFWAWATGLVKISIAFMLLKFQQNRGWRAFMYLMIFLNVIIIGFMGIANLFQCIPYAAVWDFKGKYKHTKKCWSQEVGQATLWTTCICNVVSDVVFSLMPLTFLGKIRRPLREKVVIGGLMSLGLCAAAFSLSRLIITVRGKRNRNMSDFVALNGLLICLEVQTSLIAACIPTLRSSSKRFLVRIGLLNESNSSTCPRYGPGSSMSGGPKGARKHVIELNEIEVEGTCAAVSKDQVRATDYNNDDDTGQFIADPVTGRIVLASSLKEQPSSSSLSTERRRTLGSAIEEEWELRKDIGIIR